MVGDTERHDLDVKSSINALRGPRCGLVVARAEDAPLLGTQFDSKSVVSSSSLLDLVDPGLDSIF